jgi:hypothetical protein
MRKLPSPIFHFVVLPLAMFMLFGVEFWLSSVSVFPESGWLVQPDNLGMTQLTVALDLKPLIMGAAPSCLFAVVVGLALRRLAPEPVRPRSLAKTVVASWVAVWAACMLALYVWLAGHDPTSWSLGLLTQPGTLYGLILVGLGLYAGASYVGLHARAH